MRAPTPSATRSAPSTVIACRCDNSSKAVLVRAEAAARAVVAAKAVVADKVAEEAVGKVGAAKAAPRQRSAMATPISRPRLAASIRG